MTEDAPNGSANGATGDDPDVAGLGTDELAGIADLFGAVAPAELRRAIDELAFKRGTEVDESAVDDAVDDAVASYALVRYERGDETLLAPGPTAFPTLPENAEDLPHILDVPAREVDREAAGRAVAERLEADAARAIEDADEAAMERLLDATYDVAVWSDAVDVDDVRARLDDALGAE